MQALQSYCTMTVVLSCVPELESANLPFFTSTTRCMQKRQHQGQKRTGKGTIRVYTQQGIRFYMQSGGSIGVLRE